MKRIRERERIPRMYLEEKLSTVQIGNKVGLTPGAVSSILRTRGVRMRNGKESLRARFPDGRYGKLAANWKGGRIIANRLGYFIIYTPEHPNATKDGYVMEHRLLMEKKLSRYLNKNEFVHHINGDTQDNRIENLEITSKRQHARIHFDAVKEVARLKAENDQLKAEIERLKKIIGE